MNIVLLAPRFHTNQVDLVAKLLEKGHEVSFLVMGQGQSEDHSGVKPFVVGPSRLSRVIDKATNRGNDALRRAHRALPDLRRLYGGIRTARPDVAIIRDLRSFYGLLSLPYLFVRGCHVILYTQQPQYQNAPSWKLRAFCRLAFDLLRLRGFTTVQRKGLGANGKPLHRRLEFVPFFKKVNPAARSRTYCASEPRLLTVGKFLPRKNFLLLLDVFHALADEHPCSLTLVGECSTREHENYLTQVQALIRDRGLESRIRLLLNQSYQDVQRLYLCHDLFVIPSVAEPASISQIEAMALGLPVVCSEDNGTAHYVKDGVTGFVVKPDKAGLVEAIGYFLENPGSIPEFGSKGIERLETEFNIDSAYETLMQVLQ